MESPTELSEQPKPKSIFKKTAKVLVAIVALIGLGFIILVVYLVFNPEYTEQDILKRVRSEVIPSVVRVTCWSNDVDDTTQFGTGLYYVESQTGKSMIETNAHVVLGDSGEYYGCSVYFPETDTTYDTGSVYLYHDTERKVGEDFIKGIDYAQLELVQSTSTAVVTTPFPPKVPDAYQAITEMCEQSTIKNIDSGNRVLLLGFPQIGGESLTLTEGVVSGFLGPQNQWIKVSAGASHGNSGGIAIGASDGCNYGMVSQATFEDGYNLSFVLRNGLIFDFVNQTNSTPTFTPFVIAEPKDTLKYLTATYDAGPFVIKHPSNWEVSTSTESDQSSSLIEFYSPKENSVDQFRDFVSIAIVNDADVELYKKVIGSDQKRLKTYNSKNVTGSEVRFKGLQAYKDQAFLDDSGRLLDKSLTGTRLIFLKNNTLYSIIGYWQTDKKLDYDKIIAAMIDSFELK